MDTRAYLKGTRLSPQKAGLVANAIRGKSIQEAMDFLDFNKQKGSSVIKNCSNLRLQTPKIIINLTLIYFQ